MMSISTRLMSGVVSINLDRVLALGRADDIDLVVLQQRGEREDVARVVVDHQHLAVPQDLLRSMKPLEHRLLVGRKIGDHAMQEQRGLVQQPLWRLDVLQDDALRHRLKLQLFVDAQIFAGEDDDRDLRERRVRMQSLKKLEAGHVRQPQIEHHAIEGLFLHCFQRFASASGRDEFDVLVIEQFHDRLPLDVVVFDDQ